MDTREQCQDLQGGRLGRGGGFENEVFFWRRLRAQLDERDHGVGRQEPVVCPGHEQRGTGSAESGECLHGVIGGTFHNVAAGVRRARAVFKGAFRSQG